MPNTIGQHAVATFTSPVNGTTPIDANSVRGNDNTLRSSYNNHDADPGVHVQSSTLASRPAAGTAGRKWITADAGVYKLWYDDGTRWHEVGNDAIELAVVADEALVKGDVVSVTGFNNGLNVTRVAKYTGAAPAFGIAAEAIGNGSQGYVINTGIISDVDTNAFGATGTVLYPAATGTFTSTKPTSGTYQVSAYVLRQNSTNGALYVEFSATRIVERSDNTVSTLVLRDASGNFAAGTITANLTGNISGTAPAGTLTGTTLASNVVNSSLTSVGTLVNLTVTNTIVGSINGNAATATALATARTINGVSFNGTADITVTAAAGTLTGSTLAAGVTASSLTSVGTLTNLTVSGDLTVDTSTLKVDSGGNRVGVGTATPQAPLHVKGTTDGNFWVREASIMVSGLTGTGVSSVNDAANDLVALSFQAKSFNLVTDNTLRATLDNSGNLAVDTDTLFVDAANNRVGVGTATPAYPLQVRRAGGAGSLGISIDQVGTTDRVVQYFAVQDNATGLGAGHAFYYRLPSSTSDVLGLMLDESGNVGIGTASPASKLDVNGAGRFSADGASVSIYTTTGLRHTGSGGFYLDANNGGAASDVIIRNGSGFATQLTLNGSGNLGLGVTPSANDQGNALFLASGREIIWSGPSGYLSANATYAVGADRYIISGFASSYIQTNGTHIWRTAPSGTAGNAISFTQAMTLDASGNLGVGTASPNTRLHVAGATPTLRIDQSSGVTATLDFANGSSSYAFVRAHSSTGELRYASGPGVAFGGFHTFYTDTVERARITSLGSVVVGTAALATSATDGFLYVPTCAGTPTGTPTTQTGTAPIIVDTTNHKLYFFSGGTWRDAGP